MKNAGSKRVWSVATAVLTFAAEPRLLTGEGTLVVAGTERTVSIASTSQRK